MTMENRAYALAAGVFMIVLGAALFGAFWWLGHPREAVNRYILESSGNVTGLNVQAPVRYRGIRAGRVDDIAPDPADPRLILVFISIDQRYKLTRGTVAQLNTQGVTGLSYVQLEDDGRDPRPLVQVDDQSPRIALQSSLLDKLGRNAGDIAVEISEMAVRLNQLLDDHNLRNLSKTLDNLAGASEGLKDIPQVVAALKQALSSENVTRLSTTLARLEETSAEATPLAREARAMVQNLSALTGRLDKLTTSAGGELTGSTLPRVNALVQELTETSRRLSSLIEAIDRNPQSLVFGRRNVAPGPGEPGFTAPAK